MASAQYLAERGHEVVLYEQDVKLGGRLQEASALSFKDGFRSYLEYTVRKTNESGAKIILGKKADEETIRSEAPDALVIAMGARLIVPPIKGIEKDIVKNVVEVDRKEVQTGNKVVVCGAGLSGSECALGLAMEGKDVTLVDMIPEEDFYADLIMFSRPLLKKYLSEYNVKLMGECAVQEFCDDGVIIKSADGKSAKLECDTAVIAFGVKPDNEAIESLANVVPETYVIGDAEKVGVIGDAINQAYWRCKDI